MTSAARVAMVLAAKRALEESARLAAHQAETYLLAETDAERVALLAHWAEVNAPEQVRARAARMARAKRRRQAAERGARTVPKYGIDMDAFEAQFPRIPIR